MFKSKVFIIYPNFYNFNSNTLSIGGVQTYIYRLCKLIQELGKESYVVQQSFEDFHIIYSEIQIKGYVVPKFKNSRHFLFKKTLHEFNKQFDLIIFGSENFSIKTDLKRVISIQHGIFWDLPLDFLPSNKFIDGYFPLIKRFYLRKKVIGNFANCTNKVCVDYNYLNWYRTLKDISPNEKIWVIPNFTKIDNAYSENSIIEKQSNDKIIKILFARRFVEIRGTKLMLEIIKNLTVMQNLQFTFAGEGPLLPEIKELAKSFDIQIIKYDQNDALKIHQEHHIAIVPSLGSEGTSISVAEAMSAGCAVLATNIGGITNMIINDYNGILVNPEKDQILTKIKLLVNDKDLRIKLAINGLNTVKESFSLEKWNKSWINIFNFFEK